MKNWIPKKQYLTFSIVLAIFCFILYVGGLFSVWSQLGEMEAFYNDSDSKSARYEKAKAIKSIADSEKDYIAILRGFFIKKENEVDFIEKIEEVGSTAGIKFDIFSIDSKSAKDESVKEDLMVRVNVEGDWEKILLFADTLEKMPFGISIQNLRVDAKDGKSWSGTIELIAYKEK